MLCTNYYAHPRRKGKTSRVKWQVNPSGDLNLMEAQAKALE